ncbi:HAAS domain-containing protein [Cohnella terricola]|uniref:DUF1700 domain-containing protein n=1 Tax=Cohnella terricola TaxID=1289167 RepID=A0A559JB93_9BACL|nr:DUF1700 domain-containing protein [Cohnella terricola]TVX97154.1 DUF1700 domain-containing protein [Cohnella terricola]
MNRLEFMDKIKNDLEPLPENERNELLRRCEECFESGLRQGKTEEEIAWELSVPRETPQEIYRGSSSPLPAPPWGPPPAAKPVTDTPRFIGVGIMLFFLNVLIAIPVFASLWAALISLWTGAVATLLSPVMAYLEKTLYGDFTTAKLFMALGMVGVGMLLAGLAWLLSKWLLLATKSYAIWNFKTLKGRN